MIDGTRASVAVSCCLLHRSLPWHGVTLDPLLPIPHPPAGADPAIVHVVHPAHGVEGYPASPPPSRPTDEREPALALDPHSIMNCAVDDVPTPVDDDPHRQGCLLAASQRWQRTHAFRLEVIEHAF
jgi:hypothetical protein